MPQTLLRKLVQLYVALVVFKEYAQQIFGQLVDLFCSNTLIPAATAGGALIACINPWCPSIEHFESIVPSLLHTNNTRGESLTCDINSAKVFCIKCGYRVRKSSFVPILSTKHPASSVAHSLVSPPTVRRASPL